MYIKYGITNCKEYRKSTEKLVSTDAILRVDICSVFNECVDNRESTSQRRDV